jgi:hypothetical protein
MASYKPLDRESTIDQAAEFWGVSRTTVWEWFKLELLRTQRSRMRLVLPKGARAPIEADVPVKG